MAADEKILMEQGEHAPVLRVAGDNGGDEADPGATRPALGTLLVDEGLLTSDQVRDAVAEGRQQGERLGEVLLRRQWVGEGDLARVIANQWQFPFVPDDQVTPDPTAAFLISPDEGRRLGAIPFGFDAGQAVVAIADPTEARVAAIHGLLGPSVAFVVVTQSAFGRLIGVEDASSWAPARSSDSEGSSDSQVAAAPAGGSEPAEVMGEVAAVMTAPVEPVSGELDALIPQLDDAARTLTSVSAGLGQASGALREAAHNAAATDQRVAEAEQRLAAEKAARAEDGARIVALEAELAERNELFATVKTKLSELTGTL